MSIFIWRHIFKKLGRVVCGAVVGGGSSSSSSICCRFCIVDIIARDEERELY